MSFHNDQSDILKEVYKLMQTDFKQSIVIGDLYLRYNISESTLSRAFKHQYNKTVQQHRLESCMNHAKYMIEEGQQIKLVRNTFGYKTTKSFTRSFKKMFGYIPDHYILQ
jgi:AraC-like DNA-binding protein